MTDAPDPQPAPDDDRPGPIDRLRGTGVGVEDPNIVGDVGPTDVAPGADPDPGPLAEGDAPAEP